MECVSQINVSPSQKKIALCSKCCLSWLIVPLRKPFFPNLAKLAAILLVFPVTTATVKRSFSSMKLIKTQLRNRMGENPLEYAMRICIEGPNQLSNEALEYILDHYKHSKPRKMPL